MLCSIILSLGFGYLLIWYFSGPRLGFVYDFLMSRRKVPAISSELVLIDTAQGFGSANIADPALIASVLMTLTEVNAGPALIQTSVLGISSGGPERDREIISQVTAEFSRIEDNIGNLFQGIRTGSISPLESESYVDELIALIDRGKDRLVYSVSEQELAGVRFFEDAVRIKPDVLMGENVRVAVYQSQDDEETVSEPFQTNRYSTYHPDSDGVLRRIAPVIQHENGSESTYLMYDAIKARLNPREVQFTDFGLLFTRMRGRGFENRDMFFPADKNGALLLDGLEKDLEFRRFRLNDFIKYDELDKLLFQKFEEMETLGYYDQLEPEKHPTALYRYANAMKDDLFREPGPETTQAWIDARNDYFDGVNDFFHSGVETNLVTQYEELIALEELEESAKAELVSMRNALIKTFQKCRDAYNNVSEYRKNLEKELGGAFCILGPLGSRLSSWGRGASGNPGEPEAAAHFANIFLTGNTITPVDDMQIIFWIFLWIFFLSFFIRDTNTIVTILLGILAAVLSVIFFSSLFVYWNLWIHPVIPAGTLLFTSFISVMMGLINKRRLALDLHRAYSPYVSSAALKKIIKRTGPEPWETITSYSAITAVRSRSVNTAESKDSPIMAALAVRKFRDEVWRFGSGGLWLSAGKIGFVERGCFSSVHEQSQ